MNRNLAPHHLGLALALLAMLVGCGPGDSRQRQAVSGTVTLDGNPLASGNIEFDPLAEDGLSSGANLRAGQFEIPAANGLPAGEYRVRIYASTEDPAPLTPEEAAMPELHRPGISLIPQRYNQATELRARVSLDAANHFEFPLSSDQ